MAKASRKKALPKVKAGAKPSTKLGVAASQGHVVASGTRPSGVTANTSHFLRLPAEIRDMIYNYCLVVDAEIVPYPPKYASHYIECAIPANVNALLSVNRLISEEARPVLYRKNQWRWPHLHTEEDKSIFTMWPTLFHSLTIAFDHRDVSPDVRSTILTKVHSNSLHQSVLDREGSRARGVHADLLAQMLPIWEGAWEPLLEMPEVKSITVDLTNFGCPGGCCRANLLRQFGKFNQRFLKNLHGSKMARRAKRGLTAPEVFVKGLLNAEEREIIYTHMKFKKPED